MRTTESQKFSSVWLLRLLCCRNLWGKNVRARGYFRVNYTSTNSKTVAFSVVQSGAEDLQVVIFQHQMISPFSPLLPDWTCFNQINQRLLCAAGMETSRLRGHDGTRLKPLLDKKDTAQSSLLNCDLWPVSSLSVWTFSRATNATRWAKSPLDKEKKGRPFCVALLWLRHHRVWHCGSTAETFMLRSVATWDLPFRLHAAC